VAFPVHSREQASTTIKTRSRLTARSLARNLQQIPCRPPSATKDGTVAILLHIPVVLLWMLTLTLLAKAAWQILRFIGRRFFRISQLAPKPQASSDCKRTNKVNRQSIRFDTHPESKPVGQTGSFVVGSI
jgi:hypothetical protein